MAGEFYISGLASDFDYQAYLEQIRQLKMIPVQQLQEEEQILLAKREAISQLHSLLSNLLEKATALEDPEIYDALKVYSSDSSVVSASITGSPVEGSYEVEVEQLARANAYKVGTTETITDPNAKIEKDGSLIINYLENGEENSLEINYNGKSLKEIADEINESGRFKATVINVGTADSPDYQLLITSEKSGTSNAITGIDDTLDSDGVFSEDEEDTYETISAQDARFFVDGVEFSSSVNDAIEVIDGLSLSLKGEGSATITVSKDYDRLKSALEDLLSAYNDLKNGLDALTAPGAPLNGEYSLYSITSYVFRQITDRLGGIVEAVGTVEDTKGNLALNDEAFEEFVKNPENFDKIKSLADTLETYLNSYDLSLTSRENSISEQIYSLEERIQFMTEMINKEIESERLRFAQLETYLAEMQSLQSRIEAFTASLTQFSQKD